MIPHRFLTSHRLLFALLPLRAAEQMWPHFNQPGQHLKNRNRRPAESLARSMSAAIQFLGDARIGALLNDKLHQLEKRLPLAWIFFQSLGLGRDLQAKRYLDR